MAVGDPLRVRTAHRSVADRHETYVAEIQQFIDATYRVIERTGDVDPTMRDILREAGLSTPAFYRHFRSKDELFVVILDDGRRRLVSTIERRLARETTGRGRIRAWVRAVLAQASDADAAARTRPFVANIDRLVARYPEEYRESESLLAEQLAGIISEADDLESDDPVRDAMAIYHLAFGALAWHLRNRTAPSAADIDRIVSFALRALAVAG
ncbi:MAG TPA: TetR/AcrR family transcriptional regulator [Acidimicrobiales bacterium]|jgi:AcrR family transcriptional regulator|nr:TetR/AcrR family transcriptional regulator [Acidimicrobiales bacterium]